MNHITELLGIKDENIIVTNVETSLSNKFIYLEKVLSPTFCPLCNFRMHSKGIYKRTINYSVLQDGYKLSFIIKQRKWKCTNQDCLHIQNDEFTFYEKNKHTTNTLPYLILYKLKDINLTISSVASSFHVSDTYVNYLIRQYIDLPRLPLPECLSIDEVYLNIDHSNPYALILMNFDTGEIIDILPSRRKECTQSYFLKIPKQERNQVKLLISDMYNPYINFTHSYFTNSEAIIDSFHVIQWILNKLNNYINQVKKEYIERDSKAYADMCIQQNKPFEKVPVSNEVYILNNYRWILLSNISNIHYVTIRRYNRKLRRYMDTFDYEDLFLSLDSKFSEMRILKEKYIVFNSTLNIDQDHRIIELNKILDLYDSSKIQIFRDFSKIIKKYKQPILKSFEARVSSDGTIRRLSNGPIEGFNRQPKDLKRNSRGYSNFETARARLLWSNRDTAAIRATPKTKEQVYIKTEIKRGSYKK